MYVVQESMDTLFFPPEITTQILASLPVKNNPVSCTSFILFAFDHGYLEQAYLVEDKGRLGLVVCGIAKLGITQERRYIIVEGNICHGLLLLKHSNCLRKVHNPLTGKSVELPPPDGVGAGFVVYKLGFDVFGKEFKVLRYRSNPRNYVNVEPEEDSENEESESEEESENEESEEESNNEESEEDSQIEGSKIKEFEAEVLTLGTDTWRRVGVPPYELSMSPFYFNGAIHWITKFKNKLLLIASFDMASEEFGDVPCPKFYVNGCLSSINQEYQLRVLGGCLSLTECLFENDFEIWVMKEYNVKESWTKQYIIGHRGIPYGVWSGSLKPLCIRSNGEILFKLGLNLFSYHPETSFSRVVDSKGCLKSRVNALDFWAKRN
ncbi:hypothetical protein GIB67_037360 [Kingdonia uniflora]|uniref:F-box associated beta-propeller type 3 domain-containing protein n=1 Tax=Kingdonia uniflora TaxID=39325 RepID=A0A7J7M8I6_9MAGN|nr:hypothetical protein GIB67_037360 [Kingdonia uniflora]